MTSFGESTTCAVLATDAVVIPTTNLLVSNSHGGTIRDRKCNCPHVCMCPIPDMEKIWQSMPLLRLASRKIHTHASIDTRKRDTERDNTCCMVSQGDCEWSSTFLHDKTWEKGGRYTSLRFFTRTRNNSKKANIIFFGLNFLFATFNPHFPSLSRASKFCEFRFRRREIVVVGLFRSFVWSRKLGIWCTTRYLLLRLSGGCTRVGYFSWRERWRVLCLDFDFICRDAPLNDIHVRNSAGTRNSFWNKQSRHSGAQEIEIGRDPEDLGFLIAGQADSTDLTRRVMPICNGIETSAKHFQIIETKDHESTCGECGKLPNVICIMVSDEIGHRWKTFQFLAH
jgi:hypothetical protein